MGESETTVSGKQAKRQRAVEREAVNAEMKPIVTKFLRMAVNKLRGEYARRLKIIRQNDPEGVAELGAALTPCETCAFRTSADFTDGYDGFLQTSTLLVEALDEGYAFRCHYPKGPDDSEYRPRAFPCIGWLTLQSPIPGAFDVRELLGAEVVDIMVEGARILNPDHPANAAKPVIA